jgi:hypothetical protein
MTSLTADEMFAAGHGGSYELDPKTGKRTLIETSEPTTAAPKDGPVRRKQSDPDQAGDDLRG